MSPLRLGMVVALGAGAALCGMATAVYGQPPANAPPAATATAPHVVGGAQAKPRPASTSTAAPAAKTSGRAAVGTPAMGHPSSAKPRTGERGKLRWERLREWVRSWRDHRARHRSMRLRQLHQRLQVALEGKPISAEIRAELEEHARRMARLHRVKELAIHKEDELMLRRVGECIKREQARHQRWYRSLRGDAR